MNAIYAGAEDIEYDKVDSVVVENILKSTGDDGLKVINIAKNFAGSPYLANTLENGDREHLIVNTRQFDCLTFVEVVASLYACASNGKYSFTDFCEYLQSFRYRGGSIGNYASRLHYFSWWALDNEVRGNLCSIDTPHEVFASRQIVHNNYMSNNPSKYKHLRNSDDLVLEIRQYEEKSNGESFRYIPKSLLDGSPSQLECIRTGDIIAIVTNKRGLDIAHVGFAVWVNEKLHLMHASSVQNKVIIDTKTLFEYCSSNRNHLGIRVFRLDC